MPLDIDDSLMIIFTMGYPLLAIFLLDEFDKLERGFSWWLISWTAYSYLIVIYWGLK